MTWTTSLTLHLGKSESNKMLSVIIPCLNEEKQLPLLFADLKRWAGEIEILVVDGGSSDLTRLVTKISGAKIISTAEPNRGAQLRQGAKEAKGNWLLFIHADSRLPEEWPYKVSYTISKNSSSSSGWFFDFKIKEKSFNLKLLEFCVYLRCCLFNNPYGDQGLLISSQLYKQIGGYKPLYLMEDVDINKRLAKQANLKPLRLPLITNGRKWKNKNILTQSFKNASLRRRWRKGENTYKLSKQYYK